MKQGEISSQHIVKLQTICYLQVELRWIYWAIQQTIPIRLLYVMQFSWIRQYSENTIT